MVVVGILTIFGCIAFIACGYYLIDVKYPKVGEKIESFGNWLISKFKKNDDIIIEESEEE